MTATNIDPEFTHLTQGLAQVPGAEIGIQELTPDDRFTTFSAKYRAEDDRFTIQFFVSPELEGNQRYWATVFPEALEKAAEETFPVGLRAEKHVLRGEYISDFQLNSWCLQGEGMLGDDLHERIHTLFLPLLDSMLEERITK